MQVKTNTAPCTATIGMLPQVKGKTPWRFTQIRPEGECQNREFKCQEFASLKNLPGRCFPSFIRCHSSCGESEPGSILRWQQSFGHHPGGVGFVSKQHKTAAGTMHACTKVPEISRCHATLWPDWSLYKGSPRGYFMKLEDKTCIEMEIPGLFQMPGMWDFHQGQL